MAETTGLEPAASAVTALRDLVLQPRMTRQDAMNCGNLLSVLARSARNGRQGAKEPYYFLQGRLNEAAGAADASRVQV
jgi:hypothetical protein